MASQYGFQRVIGISSSSKETTYGTDLHSGTNHKYFVSSDAFNVEAEFVEDTDTVTGHEEVYAMNLIAKSVAGSLDFPRVRPNDLATIAAYAMGDNTTDADTVASGSGDDERHKIRPVKFNAGTAAVCTLPSFTLQEQKMGSVFYTYPGCMIDSFTLSCEKKGWFSLNATVLGSGTATHTTSSGWTLTEVTDEPILKAGDANIFLVEGAGAASALTQSTSADNLDGSAVAGVTGKIQNLEWSYNNNIDGDFLYEFGSGTIRNRAERTRRTQGVTLTIELDTNFNAQWLAWLTGGTELGLEIDVGSIAVSGSGAENYGFDLLFPRLRVRSANITGGMDRLMVDVDCAVLDTDSTDDDGSVMLDVINKVSAAYAS